MYANRLSIAAAMMLASASDTWTEPQNAAAADAEHPILLVTDSKPGPGASHGIKKLVHALNKKGVSYERVDHWNAADAGAVVIAGLADGSGPAAKLLKAGDIEPPAGPEALLIEHTQAGDRPALLIAGADDRGLMYALLDVADRIGWAERENDPMSQVRTIREKPYVPERALSKYTFHRKTFEAVFHDEAYWERYLDALAANRFNTFVLIFGYENWGYFAPPYPYFVNVDSFPDVHVVGIRPEEQQRNIRSLNRIIEMAHERGLDFTLGIWDHIYRGGVQGPRELTREPTEGLVWGLTAEKLYPYTVAALREFLQHIHGIDGIQFRMHGESGLRRGEMRDFWSNVYDVMRQSGRDIRFDARAKEFPDELIDLAFEKGVRLRVCTKYWAEQMGLPFHPTHINEQNQFDRRHGYADLLRYPKRYDMHWRLWNGGTTRVLLWGDPEYVRRFAESTHLYDGDGYEVNEMLATKMQDQPHDEEPFELLSPAYRYYDWEFERYWHFLQVFGRVGYNPDTPAEVWQKEFVRRFGKDAAPAVEEALHKASQVLPRIVATSFPYNRFPMTRGWAGKQRREDLPDYADADPSDTQQFLSYRDAAKLMIEGRSSPKAWPHQTSRWFLRTSQDVLRLVAEAEEKIGENRTPEFESTVVDLKILAYLSLYHGRRPHAAVSWNLWKMTGDLNALNDAIDHERSAIEAWEKLVAAAGDAYHQDLQFGRRSVGLCGHWSDELAELHKGFVRLQEEQRGAATETENHSPQVAHVPLYKANPGQEVTIRATVYGDAPGGSVQLHYGHGSGFSPIEMEPAGSGRYKAVLPPGQIRLGLRYYIAATSADGTSVTAPPSANEEPFHPKVTGDETPPRVVHTPIQTHSTGKPLTVTADIRDPSGVRWVRLRYRGVNQHFDYETLEMDRVGNSSRYTATVPADAIDPTWDFMYLIEVMDECHNGDIYPDFEKTSPYVVVRLARPEASEEGD